MLMIEIRKAQKKIFKWFYKTTYNVAPIKSTTKCSAHLLSAFGDCVPIWVQQIEWRPAMKSEETSLWKHFSLGLCMLPYPWVKTEALLKKYILLVYN